MADDDFDPDAFLAKPFDPDEFLTKSSAEPAAPTAPAAAEFDNSWLSPVTGAPREAWESVKGTAGEVNKYLNPFSEEFKASREKQIKGEGGWTDPGTLLGTGKGVLAAASLPFAGPAGAAQSIIGRPLSWLQPTATPEEQERLRKAGVSESKIPGSTPEEKYGKAKEDVSTALQGLGARGFMPMSNPGLRPPPVPPSTRFTYSEGERTGSLPLIQKEQQAYRAPEIVGKPAHDRATAFRTQREGQLTAETDLVAPSDTVLQGTRTALDNAATTYRDSLSPTNSPLAESPLEAADIVSGSVGRAAESAQASIDAAYKTLRESPGKFQPSAFNKAPETIVENLKNRTNPIRINPETTPQANGALRALDEILDPLKQPRDPETGRIMTQTDPLTPARIESARQQLNFFYGDALNAAKSNFNYADVRATRAIVDEWDKLVRARLNPTAFKGADPTDIARAFDTARKSYSDFRKTFTPEGAGDVVGPAIQKILGRHEGQAATPAEITKILYSDGAGTPVKVGQRLVKIFGADSPEIGAVRQGLFSHITEAKVGKPDFSLTKTADRIDHFVKGEGRALLDVYYTPAQVRQLEQYGQALRQQAKQEHLRTILDSAPLGSARTAKKLEETLKHPTFQYTPTERAIIGDYAKLLRQIEVPQAGANWSNTSPPVAKAINALKSTTTALIGDAILHALGVPWVVAEGISFGASAIAKGLSNRSHLKQISKQLPLVVEQQAAYDRALAAYNKSQNPMSRGAVTTATANLSRTLEGMGIDPSKLQFLQSPGSAGAKEDNAPPEFAHGGRIGYAEGGAPDDEATFSERFDALPPPPPRWEQADRFEVLPKQEALDYGTYQHIMDNYPRKEETSFLAGANDLAKRFAQYDRQFTEDVLNFPKWAYEHPDKLKENVEKLVPGITEPYSATERAVSAVPLVGQGAVLANRFWNQPKERYQTWPEKMLRSGATLPGDVATGKEPMYALNEKTGEWEISPKIIERTQDLAGMAGSGGLGAGASADATLGSTAFLRPAVKYEGKIYKAPAGGTHLDAIPENIYPEFQRQAMAGDDISHFNFGFMNHKGQFLNREAALDYAVKEGLVDPRNANQKVLTTTLLEDSSEPGAAIAGLKHAVAEKPTTPEMPKGFALFEDSATAGAPVAALAKQQHAPAFYSDLDRALATFGRERKLSGGDWINALKNKGAKPEEMEWRELTQFLTENKGKQLTRADIQAHLDENKVEEIAKKIVNDEGKRYRGRNHGTLEGLDLEVGGEGMKGFYDKMLVDKANAIGKKYGAKVEWKELPGAGNPPKNPAEIYERLKSREDFAADYPTMADWVDYYNNLNSHERSIWKDIASESSPAPKVPVFRITPELKHQIKTKGLPLFEDALPVAAGKDRSEEVPRPVKDKQKEGYASGGRVFSSNINHKPTEAQKSAGNYAKGHVNIQGLPITIENAKGSQRSGRSPDGSLWKATLPAHYGYFKSTKGADGDHVDVYLGPHIKSPRAFIIDQKDLKTGRFDETKVLMGFGSKAQAQNVYTRAFSDGKGKQRIGTMSELSVAELKDWLKNGKTTKPYRLAGK